MSLIKWTPFEQSQLRYWRNKGVNIGVIYTPPISYDCFNSKIPGDCSRPGYGIEIGRAICEILQTPCNFVLLNHSVYGDKSTGEWTGLLKQIMDKEFDTSLPIFTPTTERLEAFDFSIPVDYMRYFYITRAPPTDTFSFYTFIHIFSWQAWITLLCSVLIIGLIAALIEHQTSSKRSENGVFITILKRSLDALSLLSAHGQSSESAKFEANYFLFWFWGLACVVLSGVFSSLIVASALDTTVDRPFHDMKTLAACIRDNGKCRLITTSTSVAFYENIRNAKEKDKDFYLLKKSTELYPPEVMDQGLLVSTILKAPPGKFKVLSASAPFATNLIEQLPSCSFDAIEVATVIYSLPFSKKNLYLKELFDKAILVSHEIGIINKIISKYVGSTIVSQERCNVRVLRAEPMPVLPFYVVLLLVALGALFAAISFAAELIVSRNR